MITGHPSYRQRLTLTGWIGLVLFTVCPVVIVSLFSSRNPEPFLLILFGVGGTVSPALLLIGREYYPVKLEATPDEDDEEEDIFGGASPSSSEGLPGVFYPGQPLK